MPRELFRRGRLLVWGALALVLASCGANTGAARGPFPRFAEYANREVRSVSFVGNLQLPADSLQAVITTHASRCQILFLPLCIPFTSIGRVEYRLDLQELALDVTRIQLYYRDHGYYGTRVVPSVDPVGEDVQVRIAVAPGDQVILRDLAVEGMDSILAPEQRQRLLPLRPGEPFRRIGFLRSADTLRATLLQRGHAYADVLRNYSIDTIADVAEAQFTVLPGPLVYVDTILFQGTDRLSQRTVRRQLTFREGQLFRAQELNHSQRNIYGLDMVSFASVQLAPDTLQLNPDSTRATVLVRVVEAAQYQVETSAGFGTVDCLRTAAQWTNRNFIGGGRRLQLSGSLSRLGLEDPVNAGLGDNVCSAARNDRVLGDTLRGLNYRLAADLQQPRLFNTRNQLSLNLHTERVTELSSYLRESVGTQVALVRGLDPLTVLTLSGNVERGRTRATAAVLCVGFESCTQEDLDVRTRYRWSNSLSLNAVRNGTRQEGPVTRGYSLRAGVDWASPFLGSDDRYLRVAGDASYYQPLRPGWILAANLRAGRFLQGALGLESGYIPPERRFYAGGPNSVRGYGRNALGPTVYVARGKYEVIDGENILVGRDTIASATGGTQMVVGSVELRTPAPVFSDLMRLAYFVDAGQVSDPRTGLGTTALRVTPGAGIRFVTPVGPFRLDVAYNPYGPETGTLYNVDEDIGLVPVDDAFRFRPPNSFLQRLKVTFAVGQAF